MHGFEVTSGQSQSDLRIIHEHDDETTESYGYMFMNKISMSHTCLYNISFQKATGFLQQSVATQCIWL